MLEFSYLRIVQKVTEKYTYQRGLRFFLDGRVESGTKMILQNWQSFNVIGRKKVYTVKMPLLHLLLPVRDFQAGEKALEESVLCNCEYFEINGVCKHIVAVCAHLDKKFGIKKTKRIGNKSLINTFFEVEQKKKYKKWIEDFQYYIEVQGLQDESDILSQTMESIVSEAFQDTTKYKEVLNKLGQIAQDSLVNYQKEKRIANLISNKRFLLLANNSWWKFWKPIFGQMEEKNKLQILQKLWAIYINSPNQLSDLREDLIDINRKLDEKQKNKIIEYVAENSYSNENALLQLALDILCKTYLEKKIELLDPIFLIKLVQIAPDYTEAIEIKLLNQVKLWSDFLQLGHYDEIVDVMKKWKSTLGWSEIFQEAEQYIRLSHKSKRKLIKLISKL